MKKSEHIRKALGYSQRGQDFRAFLQLCGALGMGPELSACGSDAFLARLASEMEEQERREEEHAKHIQAYTDTWNSLEAFMFENRKRSAPFSDLAKQVAEMQTKPGVPCCRKHAESVWMFNDLWKDLKESCDG